VGRLRDLVRLRRRRSREAKVEHLHRARSGELDVGRLEIEVDDPVLVRGLERRRDLARDLEHLVQFEWTAGESIRQRGTLNELHHDGVQAPCRF
jgi:hypothetical protein